MLGTTEAKVGLAEIVEKAMKAAGEERDGGRDEQRDETGLGEQPKFGEIGIIEDGLDHELEEVTFIAGTQVPDDGTSSVEDAASEKETQLDDIKLETEDENAEMIPGTGVPEERNDEEDVEEIGERIPEIEARWREAAVATPPTPSSVASITPSGAPSGAPSTVSATPPPRHKISWGEEPRVEREHTWHGPAQPPPRYSWAMWPGPCPEVPRYLGSLDLPEAPEAELPGIDVETMLQDQGGKGDMAPGQSNGDLRRKPESLASSKGGDLGDLGDLRRQPSRSSLVSTWSLGVRDKLNAVLPLGLAKNSDQNQLRLLVCLLFAVCFAIVITTHVFYHQHKETVRIFDLVRLEEHHRDLLLFDSTDRLVTMGHLGRLMSDEVHPYPCMPEHHQHPAVKCLEWKNLARLEVSEVGGGASCHRVVWTSLSRSMTPRDCWPIGPGEGHWYGGGERLNTTWPLGASATVRLTPFVTGDEAKTEWGNVIRKFWLNSRGLAITVDDDSPLSVSINDPELVTHGRHGLCFQASFDEFPYYYHRFNLPVLNYTVCTGAGLAEVYNTTLDHKDKDFWEGHRETDFAMLDQLIKLPVWQVPSLAAGETYTPGRIEAYLRGLLGAGARAFRGQRGLVLLDHHWQEHMGDFTFSSTHFPALRQAQDKVREAGLRLALTLNPFVSVDSPNFKECVMEGLFVMERNSTSPRGTPALTWFKDEPVAALLDITNNKTVSWLKRKLGVVAEGDASEAVFVLDTGNTFHTPHYFSFNRSLSNPDLYKEEFIREVMEVVPGRVVGVSGASSKRPKAPAFVWLSPLASSWSSLQSIVPNILHLGVIGYPFVNPGPIGGLPPPSAPPPAELYSRWWQLAIFLPQLHFLTPPNTYSGVPGLASMGNRLKTIRQEVVTPLLQELSKEAMRSGRPLVRPLWMFSPGDETSQRVADQFMLGEDLMVAPVLRLGQRQRDVYLPPSPQGERVWCMSDSSVHSGGKWLNDTKVGLHEVLYFRLQPPGYVLGDGCRGLVL